MNKKKICLLTVFVAVIILSQVAFIKSDSSKTISVKLDYKSDSVWDGDDDGVESDKAAIDFTVEDTQFTWSVDEDKLCTKWEVYSLDNQEGRSLCYGSNSCCNFINLYPEEPGWNNVLYLQYGKYGASRNNKVSARVIYVDYSLDPRNSYSNIYYSEEEYLYAVYLDDNYFEGVLEEDTTSNERYLTALSSLEKIKAKNNISRITLTDKQDNT